MADDSGAIPAVLVERDDRRWWPIAVSVGSSVASALLATALSLVVSARNAEAARDAQRALTAQVCALVVALDDNYRESPPGNELGRANASTLAQLRVALACPPAE